jgi:hypothetical protein
MIANIEITTISAKSSSRAPTNPRADAAKMMLTRKANT